VDFEGNGEFSNLMKPGGNKAVVGSNCRLRGELPVRIETMVSVFVNLTALAMLAAGTTLAVAILFP
jgi:hypothetical protein